MTQPAPPTTHSVSAPVVRLVIAQDEAYTGIMTEMGQHSVTIDFSCQAAPQLEIGEVRSYEISAARLGSTVKVRGAVNRIWEDEHRKRFRIEVGPDDLTALTILIDRRGVQRVTTSPAMRALLFSLDGERRIEATIEDLSRTGARVRVPAAQAALVSDIDALTMCMLLPGDGETLDMVGMVRNRDESAAGVDIGLEFVARGAAEFVRQLDRIERFVLDRQACCLRELNS